MKLNGGILAQEYSNQAYYTGVLSFEKCYISRPTFQALTKEATKEFALDSL